MFERISKKNLIPSFKHTISVGDVLLFNVNVTIHCKIQLGIHFKMGRLFFIFAWCFSSGKIEKWHRKLLYAIERFFYSYDMPKEIKRGKERKRLAWQQPIEYSTIVKHKFSIFRHHLCILSFHWSSTAQSIAAKKKQLCALASFFSTASIMFDLVANR